MPDVALDCERRSAVMALPECSWPENLAPNPLLLPTHLALNPRALLRLGGVAQLLTERSEFRGNPFLDNGRRIDDVAHVRSIASVRAPIGSYGVAGGMRQACAAANFAGRIPSAR